MHKLFIMILALLIASVATAEESSRTEEQKTFYALGLSVYRSLAGFALTPAELDQVKQGMTDANAGKPLAIEPSAYDTKIQDLVRARRKTLGDKQKSLNKEVLELAAKEQGAEKSSSGLIYIPLKEGAGSNPGPTDIVKVNYRGTLADGKEFDSSYKRGIPLEFRLNQVIKCWTEGLQKMKSGSKAKLVCPAAIAYGDNGAGDLILPGATLSFEVELLEVKK